jgi:hypothetical protein
MLLLKRKHGMKMARVSIFTYFALVLFGILEKINYIFVCHRVGSSWVRGG